MNSCLVKYSKCKCMYIWVIVIFPSLGTLWEQHLHPTPCHQGQEQQLWPAVVRARLCWLSEKGSPLPLAPPGQLEPGHWEVVVTLCLWCGSASLGTAGKLDKVRIWLQWKAASTVAPLLFSPNWPLWKAQFWPQNLSPAAVGESWHRASGGCKTSG